MNITSSYQVQIVGTSNLFRPTLQIYREAVSYLIKVYHQEYNCDLSASYNIGARYFIRELLKPLPEKVRSALSAKVPEVQRRTSCTLNTLLQLNAALVA